MLCLQVIYHELILTTKEYMREVLAIDPRCDPVIDADTSKCSRDRSCCLPLPRL